MNHKSLRLIIDKCGNNSLEKLKKIHAQSITLGLFCTHQPLACKLLTAYAKLSKPLEAQNVFNQIQDPDIVSWTCLISLYLHIQRPSKAFSLFSQLVLTGGGLGLGLKPDSFSVVGALSACGRDKNLLNGKTVHGMIFRYQLGSEPIPIPIPIVGNALIDMYCRNGRIESAQFVFHAMLIKDVSSWTSMLNGYVMCNDIVSARHIFDRMPQRNTVSWTAMINGYLHGKNPVQALALFGKMRAEDQDLPPTAITIVTVLTAATVVGASDLGRSIHGYINKASLVVDVTVNNALIDMYSKSGNLDLALKIFYKMPAERDVFSWSIMISGLALHGKGTRALELFSDMLESGFTPNDVTFVSVLSACSHAGLVSVGKRLFNRLVQCYGLKPKIEHYGCIVDLLSRAGFLDEAVELIEGMPIRPDAVMWRSLLSGCLGHGNLKLAEMAGKKILELEPDDDGVYILLWNIYYSGNRWADALNMRKLMRDQKIKKKPGCSWIELNGTVHEFIVEDTMNQDCTDAYIALEAVVKHSKLDFDLTNVE